MPHGGALLLYVALVLGALAHGQSLVHEQFYGVLRLFLFFESPVPPEARKIWRNSPIFGLKPLLRENHAE